MSRYLAPIVLAMVISMPVMASARIAQATSARIAHAASAHIAQSAPVCVAHSYEARQLITRNGLLTAGAVTNRIMSVIEGRIFNVKLCRAGNSFFYKIYLWQQSPQGRVMKTLAVDARNGRLCAGTCS